MRKVVIKLSQGSVVTQTVLGGRTIHLPVANFLCFISAKKYENWLRVDKVIATNTVCSFFGPPCRWKDGRTDGPHYDAGQEPIILHNMQYDRLKPDYSTMCLSCS